MLKIKDMNLNNVIRQGDSQPREYQLDTGNLNLNLTNRSATIRLMTADFQGIGYETTATVSSENKISFSIDDVIPARQYRLEVTVDDYVFPSRATDGQFNIDPSSHGQEVNIINVIGKDEIVRDVKARVENELEPLVTSLESAQQSELDRQAQEEARESNEQTRLNKDLLRDDKIAQMEADKDAVIANATVDSEVILARGGKATLGQRLDETTAQLAQTRQDVFMRALNVRSPFGLELEPAVGDGITDDTEAINACIEYAFENGISDIFIPDGVYLIDPSKEQANIWSEGGIIARTGVNINMSRNTVLKAKPIISPYYDIISMNGVDNIKISGGKIIGERNDHLGVGGDHAFGIKMLGTKNIVIEDITITNCWGDGIYLGRYNLERRYCENTILRNVISDNNRRQGITVISVKGLYGYDVELKNTNGTAPQAGIDFEPNESDEFLENIRFYNLKTENNAGSGIEIMLQRLSGNYKIDMSFHNYESDGDYASVHIQRFKGKSAGTIFFDKPVFKNSYTRPFNIRAISKEFSKIILDHPTFINSNTSNDTSVTRQSPITFIRQGTDFPEVENFVMGNVSVINPNFIWEEGYSNATDRLTSFHTELPNADGSPSFSDIELIGYPQDTIYGNTLITNSVIDTSKMNEFTFFSQSNPVGSAPLTSRMHAKVLLPRYADKDVEFTLLPGHSEDIAFPIHFTHNGSVHSTVKKINIRPEEASEMRPKTFAKGVRIEHSADHEGSTLTVRKIKGYWTIVNMVGDWEPIP